MKTVELAQQLDISRQMVNKLRKRGMPVDSLEAAIEWRNRNLNPITTKEGRLGGNTGFESGSTGSKKRTVDNSDDKDTINAALTYALTGIMPQLVFTTRLAGRSASRSWRYYFW